MRTFIINGVSVRMPNAIVYAGDDNWIEFVGSGSLGEVGVEISSSYATVERLVYTTPTDRLRMNISAALLPHLEGAGGLEEITVTILLTVAGGTSTQTAMLRYGRTLSTRTHHAEGTILCSKDATAVGVFLPADGGITVNGIRTEHTAGTTSVIIGTADTIHIDLVASYTVKYTVGVIGAPDEGHEYTLTATGNQLTISGFVYDEYEYEDIYSVMQTVYIRAGIPTLGTVVMDADRTILGTVTDVQEVKATIDRGEVGYFYDNGVSEWDVKIHRLCAKEKEVRVGYYNTDGVWRSVVGELMTDSLSSEGDTMRRVSDVRRHEAWRHITAVQQTITVGFADIPHDAYLEDMLASWYVCVQLPNGEEIPAVPVTKKLGGIDGSNITIELEVLS